MKRFTKITLIIAAVMAIVGVICMGASLHMGLTLETFVNMIADGKFSFGAADIGMKGSENTTIEEACQSLEVEFGAGVLNINYEDVKQIQIEQENVSDFEAYVKGGTLYIYGEKNRRNGSSASITIALPQNMRFEEADLNIGASKAEITDVVADDFSIEVGAGEAAISNLDAQELTVSTGIGKVSMELAGEERDYNYHVECGIGSITIGENTYGGLGTEQEISNPAAKRSMDVECGIGEVEIYFTE